MIDSENKYQMSRATNVNGVLKLTPTDHHTLILTLQNLPMKVSDEPTKKEVGWCCAGAELGDMLMVQRCVF